MHHSDPCIRAQIAALLSMGASHAPLTTSQATYIVISAIEAEAARLGDALPPAELQYRLTLHGMRALHEAQAGLMDRALIIQRIESLTKPQQAAYSLRYEHGMADAQIAEHMGVSEEAIVALMLRTLLTITGVSDDT